MWIEIDLCLINTQLIFYPLVTFALVFFGIKIFKGWRNLAKKNIESSKTDKGIDPISE